MNRPMFVCVMGFNGNALFDHNPIDQGGVRLNTDQLDTTNHSDRCLEAFHCLSAVSGSCSIDSCPNEGHSIDHSHS